MQAFLIRHAAAIDETLEVRDPHRHLTAHGRTQARSLGERLRWHDCEPTHIWSSPFVRAIQTAELVAAGLQVTIGVDAVPALAHGGSIQAVLAAIYALPATANVVLVGHEPGLSAIGANLIGEELPALARAEAVRIIDARVRWRFAWDADAPR